MSEQELRDKLMKTEEEVVKAYGELCTAASRAGAIAEACGSDQPNIPYALIFSVIVGLCFFAVAPLVGILIIVGGVYLFKNSGESAATFSKQVEHAHERLSITIKTNSI